MSSSSSGKQLHNEKNTEQQNDKPKINQKMEIKTSQFFANIQTDQDLYSIRSEFENESQDMSDILSNIAESISKDELKILISDLKQKQSVLNISVPILERKQKILQLPIHKKLQREKNSSKYVIGEQILQKKESQEQIDRYENINVLGDSAEESNLPFIKHNILQNELPDKEEILESNQKINKEELRQKQLQEQEDVYGSISILGDSILEYDLSEISHASHNKLITSELKEEQEQLNKIQSLKQEDLYSKMNLLGDSVLEYNLAEIPYIIHNKSRKPHRKSFLTIEEKFEQAYLRQNQLQEQEEFYSSINILGDSVLEYNLNELKPRKKMSKRKITLTSEQKEEKDQLRQIQLQEQEDLYEQVDLLGESMMEFNPLLSNVASYDTLDNEAFNSTITSISPDEVTPQTSSRPHRISKYLSPEQVAQLAKIRKQRYELQIREYSEGDLLGESAPNALKEKYSFRQPNARFRSPRELVYRKSLVNIRKNKEEHSKALILPVMEFPPTNWPTPIIPEIRQDLEKLRQEQRQYFISMQQAHASQNSQSSNQSQDTREHIIQGQNIKSTQNQKQNSRPTPNEYERNFLVFDNDVNLTSMEDIYKFLRGVYIILFVQWLLITGIVSLFKYHTPSLLWLKSSGNWTWLYILCILNLVFLSFLILPLTRNNFPINFIMLTFFTLLVAFMFSFVEVYYPNDSVLLALTCTCTICVVLMLFFCQIRFNFTIFSGLSLCIVTILLVLGIFCLIIELIILEIFYAAIGVLLYSTYLVFDTNEIVTGNNNFQIEYDNYFLGAIHLNLDFIFISAEKLNCKY